MKNYSWYKNIIKRQEDDLDYILEEKKLDITESICQIMQESKITRKKLAEKMETSPAAITKFLNGDTNFTLKTLIKFSLCLEKDLIFSFSAKRKKRFDPFEYFHSQKVTTITYGLMNDCSIWSSADSQKTPFPKNWNVNSADSIPCVGKCAV